MIFLYISTFYVLFFPQKYREKICKPIGSFILHVMSDKSPPCFTETLSTCFFKAKNLISFKLQSSFNLRLQIPVTAVKHSYQNCLPKRTQLRTQSLAKNVPHKNCGRKTNCSCSTCA